MDCPPEFPEIPGYPEIPEKLDKKRRIRNICNPPFSNLQISIINF